MAQLVKGYRSKYGGPGHQSYDIRCGKQSIGAAFVEKDQDEVCAGRLEKAGGYHIFIEIEREGRAYRSGHECAETRKEAEEILRHIASRESCDGIGVSSLRYGRKPRGRTLKQRGSRR